MINLAWRINANDKGKEGLQQAASLANIAKITRSHLQRKNSLLKKPQIQQE